MEATTYLNSQKVFIMITIIIIIIIKVVLILATIKQSN